MSSSYFGAQASRGGGFDMNSIFKDSEISAPVRQHLINVYGLLTGTVVMAAIGALAQKHMEINASLCTIALILGFMYLHSASEKPPALLLGIGFLQGCALGPLLDHVAHVDPSIIVTAFLGTSSVFLCFTFSAMVAKRRTYLAIGGMLSSSLTALFFLTLFNMYFQSPMVVSIYIYGGLVIFCGYVLYDTQLIIEKAIQGDRDYVSHAVHLFIDFVAVFRRLLIILMDKEKEANRNKNNQRR